MKDSLGARMKSYENISRHSLVKKVPVIIRLDGKAFHSFTKGLSKPFDNLLTQTMQETALYLCKNVQGCKMAYTQSDEISLLLTDYESILTQGFFDYNIQKMTSISASIATLAFNKIFYEHYERNVLEAKPSKIYRGKINKALFDSRAFNLPKEEICNYFIWRQKDAITNSIQMVGQAYFSSSKLHGKSCEEVKELLLTDKDIDYYSFPSENRQGTCIIRVSKEDRKIWTIDKEIPIFTEDRDYIEKYL